MCAHWVVAEGAEIGVGVLLTALKQFYLRARGHDQGAWLQAVKLDVLDSLMDNFIVLTQPDHVLQKFSLWLRGLFLETKENLVLVVFR